MPCDVLPAAASMLRYARHVAEVRRYTTLEEAECDAKQFLSFLQPMLGAWRTSKQAILEAPGAAFGKHHTPWA